jgi:hypothetical protein
MNDEELLKNRTALLKEITKVGKERDWRRAEALLRSLGSGRRTFTGPLETWRGQKVGVKRDMRSLAIGKEVNSAVTMPQGRGFKNLQAGLSFGNTFPGDGSSIYDKPKKTGVTKMTPLKRAALGFMIGDQIQSWPNKDLNYKVEPTDKARSRLYRMMSGGAIDAYTDKLGYETAQGMRRGEDKFQPRGAKGRMQKQVTWNPKSLKKPLYDMAIGKGMKYLATGVIGDQRAQLLMTAFDVANQITKQATGEDLSQHYERAGERFKDSGEFTTP